MIDSFAKAVIDPNSVGIPTADVDSSVANIIPQVYMIAGAVAVLVIVIAGIMFVTSAGNPEKVKKAKNAIIGASVGLIVILLAFAITAFITGNIQ